MKRIIVFLAIILAGTVLFSSCKTRQKCAAYGYYSHIENEVPAQDQL